MPVTAIFDVGKTNKKFFLLDEDLREVHRSYTHLPLIEDEDGFPTEDLEALVEWMQTEWMQALEMPEFEIQNLNFSSYGASLVHLDAEGEVVTPLYNYTKPYPVSLEDAFYECYGPEAEFNRHTGSSRAGMLTSGLQLYWLKHRHPETFSRIHRSLHLPQYLSAVFSGRYVSEYTSIGCHTGLWDYRHGNYHSWVAAEGLEKRLPPIVNTTAAEHAMVRGQYVRIGVGIHDSSAALLPYIESLSEPFALLSTGTWSVAMNPFSDGHLSGEDLAHDCINYMRTDGSPVEASRLFLGQEFKDQLDALAQHYKVPRDSYKSLAFDPECYRQIRKRSEPSFRWVHLKRDACPAQTQWIRDTYSAGYHQLVFELCQLQVRYLRNVIGDSGIRHLYLDGGFSQNEVFIQTLAQEIDPMIIRTTDASLGSALGAAIAVTGKKLSPDFLRKQYAIKETKPLPIH